MVPHNHPKRSGDHSKAPPFGYQNLETMDWKKLEFPQELLAGRSKRQMQPEEEFVSLKGSSQFCQRVRLPVGETGPKTMMNQWWAELGLGQACLAMHNISSALYLNLSLMLGLQRWMGGRGTHFSLLSAATVNKSPLSASHHYLFL